MHGHDHLTRAWQPDLPQAQNHLAVDTAPDRHADGPHAGLTTTAGQRPDGNEAIGINAIARRNGVERMPRKHKPRRFGLRLWTLLHAQSLLKGPGSGADVIAFIEDDYRRLSTRASTDADLGLELSLVGGRECVQWSCLRRISMNRLPM